MRVLLVEDDPAHAELARRAFDSRPGAFSVAVAETVAAAQEALAAPATPDIVIADWRLPDGEGVDLLRGDPEGGLPPIVIMTSQGSEKVAVEVMRAGAADYVVKSEAALADLAHVATRALRQRRIQEAVGDIAAGTSGTGEAFFQSIVLRLARALRVKYASVAELLPEGRVRTLGRCIDGRLVENVEYALSGTPCGGVLDGSVCYVRHGVAEAFPEDEALARLGAQSYVGAALPGSTGRPLGLVNAVHERPLDEVVRPEMVVQVFASRAAAELERRRAEEALRASEARYRTLMRNAPEAILVTDVERDIVVDANANAERLFGIDRDELLRTRPGALLPEPQSDAEPSRATARHLVKVATEGGTPVAELVLRTSRGKELPCEVRLVRLPGPASLVRISIIDISQRKHLEANLRGAALEWRQTFDGLPLGVLVVDGEGRVIRANRTAVEHSGRASWGELIETPLDAIGSGEIWTALGEMVHAMRTGGQPAPREVTDSATGRTWVVSASPLATDSEGPGRVVLNFQDVSQTVDLKEQLRQSETMAAIGSIVAGVAHEVRNPLFSISATLDAFESRFGEAEAYERYLAVLRGEIGRLTTLMKDLLEFGRPSVLELGECDVEEVARAAIQACEPLLKQKRVEVTQKGQAGVVPPVLADRVRMTQVLQNLIENAIHYSPSGGRVEVALGWVDDEEGEWVECAVRDSGPGFAPADLEQLFEPFFTRRRGGTGLGLSIVKRIVYDHGGDVFARNHPDGGAVVIVRLRRARP